MLTGKQRSILKSMANTLQLSVIIGKQGLTENVIKQIDDQLWANELVKIKVLETSDATAKELTADLLDRLHAEFISQLGSKLVLYRPAKKPIIQLPVVK